jgi:predicted CopG family antitoxin
VHDKCMAVKTITIDMEAYTLLSRRKETGQSFSDVIKSHFGKQPTAGRFRLLARTLRIGDDALDAMEAQVTARSASPARVVRP